MAVMLISVYLKADIGDVAQLFWFTGIGVAHTSIVLFTSLYCKILIGRMCTPAGSLCMWGIVVIVNTWRRRLTLKIMVAFGLDLSAL